MEEPRFKHSTAHGDRGVAAREGDQSPSWRQAFVEQAAAAAAATVPAAGG